MKLQPVADRLIAAKLGFRAVEGLAALSEANTRPLTPPCAYVIPDDDRYSDVSDGSGVLEQLVTVTIGVLIVVATGGAQLAGPIDLLDDLETATIDSLFGWMIPGGERPLKLRRRQLVGIGGGKASRLLTFETVHRLRKLY